MNSRDERRPGALDVVEACAVRAGGAEHPFAEVERILDRDARRAAALVGQLATERKIVGRARHVIVGQIVRRHAAKPAGRGGVPSVQRLAVRTEIAKHAGAAVLSAALMQNEIEIDVDIAGMCDGDQTRQRRPGAVARGDRALLALAADVAGIEHAIAVTARPRSALRLRRRRQLDRGEADIARARGHGR